MSEKMTDCLILEMIDGWPAPEIYESDVDVWQINDLSPICHLYLLSVSDLIMNDLCRLVAVLQIKDKKLHSIV